MNIRALEQLKSRIGHAAQSVLMDHLPVGGWLESSSVPERLIVKPVDCWPGNAENGQQICSGIFTLGDDELYLQNHHWQPFGISQNWLKYLHGFEWLRDLRALGGQEARLVGRALIADWIAENRDRRSTVWDADTTARRLAMWIAHFDCFCAGLDEDFLDPLFLSMARQSRHLSAQVFSAPRGTLSFAAIRGVIYGALAFDAQQSDLEKALEILTHEIESQILADGSHASRSPQMLLESLMMCLDIRMALLAGGCAPVDRLQDAIERMGPALRFFVYGDKHLAVCNGGQEGHSGFIESALAQAGVRGKIYTSLPSAMYERITQGRSLLLFDGGRTPARPFDRHTHAAPLAFEFAHGKDRMMVSCGAHPFSPDWQDSLRQTAAHNTLCIDNRNAGEIRADGHFTRKINNPFVKRLDTKTHSLIEASHDGYLPLNGLTHHRRLFLCDQGHDLRGEDTLEGGFNVTRSLDYAVRFHLHPKVLVSLIRDGEEALLRLPNGVGWRFQQQGGTLSLENSVYLGTGSRARKTKQLVVYGRIDGNSSQIRWALQREGL